jgi:CheY-like chemotaxis protein
MFQTEEKPSMLRDLTGKRIFIVEDDAIIRDLYKDVLSRQDCEIFMAASGEEAIEMWPQGVYDLLICDLGLPGMDGWEFINFVRKENNSIPIIALTGWGDMISKEKSDAHQVERVVSKPVKLNQLLGYISDLIYHSK